MPARILACRACRPDMASGARTGGQLAGSAGRNEEYEGRSTERRAMASPAGVSTGRGVPGG